MRTTLTLNIPDNVLLAEARGITEGDALAELARRGLEIELEEIQDGFWKGVKLFPHLPDDPPVTLELLNHLRDELPLSSPPDLIVATGDRQSHSTFP